MPDFITATLAEQEWRLWQALCAELRATGAVTQTDLNTSIGAAATPGQRLLSAIRTWGDACAVLHATRVNL